MPDLPTGTVTFLLTDIEGSTRLWEQHPGAMEAALARHDTLAAEIIGRGGGTLVKHRGEGDSIFAVFARALDAVTAAADLQRALATETWPSGGELRVRMALHTGDAALRDGDYFGPAVNRCARLRAAAHGGQVLLSQATRDLTRDNLPPETSLRDLGSHRLRDLQEPEHLFQLLHPHLPSEFPPLRSLEAFAHNLPRQLTSFIGREREMAEVNRLLETTALLTLTGSGGCGKTRLALQVAADLVEEFADGVWLVELAALADPALLPQSLAATLGVREEPGRPLEATLTDYLRNRHLLLILDNCEHLLGACARLVESLLRVCPRLKVLASSREGLGIAGETTYRLPSLSLPDPKEWSLADGSRLTADDRSRSPSASDHGPSTLLQYEAVRLFLDRARAAQPSFTVDSENVLAVVQVCRRLDGIPLAIELAAARVRVLPVEKIAERLDDRFRLLTGGSRTALPRQQTLRALIDWSYDLLTEPEQAMLRRLSVFAGGWTLEAAEAVCADGAGVRGWGLGVGADGTGQKRQDAPAGTPTPNPQPLTPSGVLDLLTSLVEKSLVIPDQHVGARYRLLETVRQYARDRLLEAGEVATLRARHRDWFADWVASRRTRGRPKEDAWRNAQIEAEHDNLRAALEWSIGEDAGGETGLRLAVAMWQFWHDRGYLWEGRHWLQQFLAVAPDAPSLLRQEALKAAALLTYFQGDFPAAGEFNGAGIKLAQERGDEAAMAWHLVNLGYTRANQGDTERAHSLFEQSLALFERVGGGEGRADTLAGLGTLASNRQEYASARALVEEALRQAREVDSPYLAFYLWAVGHVWRAQGELAKARTLYREALLDQQQRGLTMPVPFALDGLAQVAAGEGYAARAARLFGIAAALRQKVQCFPLPLWQGGYEKDLADIRARLGEEVFASAWEAGQGMSLAEAIAYALEEDTPDA